MNFTPAENRDINEILIDKEKVFVIGLEASLKQTLKRKFVF